jgi:hypothetical protein
MKDFTENFGFVVAFLAGTLVSQMFLGSKFTNRFLILVILSAILINAEKFTKLLDGVTK